MFLLKWYEQWLELRREYKPKPPCESCETLKIQVEALREDNRRLLDRMLEKPEPEPQRAIDTTTPIIPRGRQLPWKVRQQMLEANDRDVAAKLKNAPKPRPQPVPVTTTQDLEDDVLDRELDNAERERQAEGHK